MPMRYLLVLSLSLYRMLPVACNESSQAEWSYRVPYGRQDFWCEKVGAPPARTLYQIPTLD
eukprot:scaffold36995_cov51-Attheya_sp.AAC.1